MSAIAEYELVWKEASLTKDYSEVKKFQINFLFWKKYKEKKYDKLNSEIVNKFLKTKLVISESFYQKLKTNKVLIELILVLKILYKKNKNIDMKNLINLGFKKTSLKYAIKKLIDLELIDKNYFLEHKELKIKKAVLRQKGEKTYVLKGENTWKIFLLYGLSSAILYEINKFKSKKIYDKKFNSKEGRRKVILQNAYYANLNLNRLQIYKINKNICNYLNVSYKEMFEIVKTQLKKFISVYDKYGNMFRKFVGYKFISKRYLLMRI